MKPYFLLAIFYLMITGCGENVIEPPVIEPPVIGPEPPVIESITILEQLQANYVLLPEKQVSISVDGRVHAAYTGPSDKYAHGILGDRIEATQLVVVVDSVFYELDLEDNYVFEDIRPRLYDVDNDGELEIITIRTEVSSGAGIVIYKVRDSQITEYAVLPEIGNRNRWLNPVAINDLDNDGIVEIAWIQTPHIGGILKVAKIAEGTLEAIDEASLYSNHAIGERNLCLSVLTEEASGLKLVYVPNQDRNKIVGFALINKQLFDFKEMSQNVDFSMRLKDQYAFDNIIEDEGNCIFVE